MFNIEFYEKIDKTKPAYEFILSLREKLKVKTLRDLKLLQEFGYEIREPFSKKITSDGIFELRSKQGTDIVRVFYFFVVNKTIIITNGYQKKQNEISKNDLELARKYMKDYLDRKGGIENG